MWVVLPLKDFGSAKGRLSEVLGECERSRLFEAMVEDVLTELGAAAGITGVVVVSEDVRAAELAARHGAECIGEDPAADGLNGAVARGAEYLLERGVEAMVALHGDLPLLAAAEIEQVVRRAEQCRPPYVVLVADDAGDGTNLLACSLPEPIAFRYGPRSFAAHRRAAEEVGAQVATLVLPTVAFDVDTPHDLRLLAHRLAEQPASHTAAVVAELGLAERLATSCS